MNRLFKTFVLLLLFFMSSLNVLGITPITKENVTVFLFSRDPVSPHQLTFIPLDASFSVNLNNSDDGNKTVEFNDGNLVCAQQTQFVISDRNPYQNFTVMEWNDFEQYKEIILSSIVRKFEIILVDSKSNSTPEWFTFDETSGTREPLDPKKYEGPQIYIHVCTLDELVLVPDNLEIWNDLVISFSAIGLVISVVSLGGVIYWCHSYNENTEDLTPSALLIKCMWFLIFCYFCFYLLFYMSRFLGADYVDPISAGIAFSAFYSFIRISFVIIQSIVILGLSPNEETEELKYRLKCVKYTTIALVLLVVLSAILLSVTQGYILTNLNLIGPDNGSSSTGHFYVNTMADSLIPLLIRIRIM
jgi:hypothetical protein